MRRLNIDRCVGLPLAVSAVLEYTLAEALSLLEQTARCVLHNSSCPGGKSDRLHHFAATLQSLCCKPYHVQLCELGIAIAAIPFHQQEGSPVVSPEEEASQNCMDNSIQKTA